MSGDESINSSGFLAKLKLGDVVAITRLVAQYHTKFKAVLTGLLGEASAEDALQEAWLAIFKHLHQFEGRASLATWMYRIVINSAKSRLRKPLNLELAVGGGDELDAYFNQDGGWQQVPNNWALASPDELLEQEELCKTIIKSIESLPAMQQSVLLMHDFDGLALDDISELLSLSYGNVKVLLHRARKAIYCRLDNSIEP